MELKIKTVPAEGKGFKPGEVAKLTYDAKTVAAVLKETPNKSEALDWLDTTLNKATADIAIRCIICDEYTPMNSWDSRTHEVFICDKCKTAILYIRKFLEDGGNLT